VRLSVDQLYASVLGPGVLTVPGIGWTLFAIAQGADPLRGYTLGDQIAFDCIGSAIPEG
jgi:hypothetical protein